VSRKHDGKVFTPDSFNRLTGVAKNHLGNWPTTKAGGSRVDRRPNRHKRKGKVQLGCGDPPSISKHVEEE
jgi:hypothetical protein